MSSWLFTLPASEGVLNPDECQSKPAEENALFAVQFHTGDVQLETPQETGRVAIRNRIGDVVSCCCGACLLRSLPALVVRAMDRVTRLKELLREHSADSFARYGLAMEYAKQGSLVEALSEFQTLVASDPDYVAAYYQAGQVLEKLNRTEEARQMYRRGVEVATRRNDSHTRSELEGALELLG
jgi:tetratricopeptide (TPR) repeat protein